VGGTLFFRAFDFSQGSELWKSNGTSSGTALVKDIFPGGAGSNPSNLTNVSGTLFFSADDGSHGYELWQSNGTSSGTVMLKDINPGFAGSDPKYLTNVSGHLFFAANDGSHGYQLWDPPVNVAAAAGSQSIGLPAFRPAAAPVAVAPSSVPTSPSGMSSCQQAFWLEALLLADPSAAALGEEMALLAVLPSLPPGDSALALDFLLASLPSGTAG
jgi:ELWxxDGT repeat protein